MENYFDPEGKSKVTPFPHLLLHPPDAWALLVLAHGAGAGMRHRFMESMAERLARRGVATLRYEFPYWARGSRRVDPPAVLERAVRDAVTAGALLCPDLPRFVGGKSLGGRMTTRAAADGPLNVRGIVLFGFPLHPAKRPGIERAEHLTRVPHPMLFLQGTRDALADLDLLGPVLMPLQETGLATLHVVEGADHGFDVLKRSGRTGDQVLEELADVSAAWMRDRVG